MVKLVTIIIGLSLTYIGYSQTFNPDISITIDPKNSLVIASSPSLQMKKLSQIKIKNVGTAQVEVLSFNATMPDHDHGMVVTPSKPKKQQDGSFLIKGIKLHMPGLWLLETKVKINGIEKTFKGNFNVRH